MKLTVGDDGSLEVRVRQSWLNDAVQCGERGRQQIVRPEWSMPNDATILGTAVHAGIAYDLERDSMEGAVATARNTLAELLEQPMRWVKYNRAQLDAYIPELLDMYERKLRPQVRGKVDAVEWEFEFELDEFVITDVDDIPVRVIGVGTVDAVVHTTPALWDWKTAGKKYRQSDKQKTAVQPTMYAAAAVAHGKATYPVRFNYGVMVRDADAQIVPVVRTERHVEWLRMMIRPFIRTAVLMGTDEPWQRNDDHYLCSQKWCSWWSVCKGSALLLEDIYTPQELR